MCETSEEQFVEKLVSGEETDLSSLPAMKISLAPGQKLIVGFYVPANQQEDRGWTPRRDYPLDGEFTVAFEKDAITVSSDMPDDEDREGIIYRASYGHQDDEVEDEDGVLDVLAVEIDQENV